MGLDRLSRLAADEERSRFNNVKFIDLINVSRFKGALTKKCQKYRIDKTEHSIKEKKNDLWRKIFLRIISD